MSAEARISAAAGGGVQHFWLPAGAPGPPRIARAEGVHLWDQEGRRYFDVTSGPVAVNLGHGNPRVLAAMRAQAERVCFAYPTAFESESNVDLGDLVCRLAGPGLDRAFFVSGGSEAVEKCLEFARLLAVARGEASRHKVVSRRPSYHGSTLATLALGGNPHNAVFEPMARPGPVVTAPSSYRPPAGLDAAAHARRCAELLAETIEREGPETVLAFILEPVMGLSGGADHADEEYYGAVRRICSRYGVLLIYDEVISGAGRTGRFLASHWWPAGPPDLVVLAKGLGSGYYPIGAFLADAAIVDEVVAAGGFFIGHTHKASPLACAVGLAVLQETERQDLMRRAEVGGTRLRAALTGLRGELGILGDVRGLGLLNAIELVADQDSRAMLPRHIDVPRELAQGGLEHGLMIYARRTYGGEYGDWIMVSPPLIVTDEELDELVEALRATLRDFQDRLAREGHLP